MKRGFVLGLIGLVVLGAGAASWLALKSTGAAPSAVVAGAVERDFDVESTDAGLAEALPSVAPAARVAAGELSPTRNVEVTEGGTAGDVPGRSTVVFRPSRTVTLEVVAAGTDQHLKEVDVYQTTLKHSPVFHPTGQSWAKLAEGESSPVQLRLSGGAATSSRVFVVVGAQGYAWKRVALDGSVSGAQRVELDLAGSLRVDYDGDPPLGSKLRLYAENFPFAELWLESETTIFTGLSPGTYRVSVEVGNWFSDPAVMGEQEVSIAPARRAAVRLLLQVPTVSSTAAFSGTLVVPTQWGELDHELTLQQLTSSADGVKTTTIFKGDTLVDVPGRAGHYTYTVPVLETGVYSLRYEPLNWAQAFEHPLEGTHEYRLEVPPPVSVTLRAVLQAADESWEPLEKIIWRPVSAEGVSGGKRWTALREPGTNIFTLSVPMGKFTVSALQEGYAFDYVELDASTAGDFLLKVKRSTK